MGNYSLVADSSFKAKSFDELIKPYLMYTSEYNAQEEALSELATKADIWQGLANAQTDPVAYAQYTNYANALKDQAAIIASSGLNPTSRQTLLNLKRRYASEIAPIETAYNTRKAQAEEQRKALLQNPTLLLSRRADTTSLDDYMENPNLGYESYNGALLTQQVGQAAANIAKELRAYGNGENLDEYTKTWLQRHGYRASEVAFAINHPDDPRASRVLNTIVNNVINDSGISEWADLSTLNQAYSYARQGLWNAVGQTHVNTYSDTAAIAAAKGGGKPTKEEEEDIKNRIKPVNLFTKEEKNNFSSQKEKFNEWVDKGYITKDSKGRWRISKEGLEYANSTTSMPGTIPITGWKDSAFRDFLKEVGAVEDKEAPIAHLGSAGAYHSEYRLKGHSPHLIEKYKKTLEGGYDATKTTAFMYNFVTQQDQNNAKDAIALALKNKDLTIVEFEGPDTGYRDTAQMSYNDFVNKDTRVLGSVASKYGHYFKVQTPDGTTYTVHVPGTHNAQQDAAVKAYIAAAAIQDKIKELKPKYEELKERAEKEGLRWEDFNKEEQSILIDYPSYLEQYEPQLWNGHKAQGRVVSGTSVRTLNIE